MTARPDDVKTAGKHCAGVLTIMTHIEELHDRGLISAPKNARIFSCTLCIYITVPAFLFALNNPSSTADTPGGKADGRQLPLVSQGFKLYSKIMFFFHTILHLF